jgi:aspartate/methionine/tyrosine aminotransferase
MDLPPFLLDQWLAAHEFATPPIRYNLASSTGPSWTFAEVMALGGASLDRLADVRLSYGPPQGTPALREQIARFYDVDPDWVVVTTGASEALLALYCSVAEPGASLTLPSPVFAAMDAVARGWGLRIDTYSLDRENAFVQTAQGVLAAVNHSTRLVLVNTPHNPTGAVMNRSETEQLAAALAERRIPLLVDEVYHPLYFGDAVPSAAKVPNTIVISDFSKALSIPGLRIGWIIDRDATRRERLINLRSYFTVSGSPLTEALAVHALAHRKQIFERLEHVARANLRVVEQFMQQHREHFGWVAPRGGTVAFPWRLDGKSSRAMCEALARSGVLMAPGDCFDKPEHFRIGFAAAQPEGVARALDIATHLLQQSP